ncbi:MAG: cupin domain-containing protein [Novosphingobium sp.]|nr:cupin domain-containing protein [Novosphingobium sp.]
MKSINNDGENAMSSEQMSIFRANKANEMTGEDGHFEPPPPNSVDGWSLMFEAGLADGTVAKKLFDAPGFSLIYNWFKPHFPLPRHSHSQDCLYYIISGSLRLGTEDLAPGDGFFIGADVPYTYKVGADGLEILEFRHEGYFTTRSFAANKEFWDKTIASIAANRETWKGLTPPQHAG